MSQVNILIDELKRVTGNTKFELLREKPNKHVPPGETKYIIKELKKTAEAICYKAANNLITMPERFNA